MRQDGPDGYWVSDDRSLIDVDLVHAWMSEQSYWARGRSYPAMVAAIENSLVFDAGPLNRGSLPAAPAVP